MRDKKQSLYQKKAQQTRESTLFYLDLIQLNCPKKKALSLALYKNDFNQRKPCLEDFMKKRGPKEDLKRERYMRLKKNLVKKKHILKGNDYIEKIYEDLKEEFYPNQFKKEVSYNSTIKADLDSIFSKALNMLQNRNHNIKTQESN